MAQVLTQQEETDSNRRGMEDGRERVSDTTPTSERPDGQSGEVLMVHGKDLLANINKLATKAAANLRSMPHF